VAEDNGSFIAKQRARLRLVREIQPDARIFEAFAGEGRLYAGAWSDFGRGACIDKDEAKCRDAARQRPTWAVYRGDSERLLLAGIGAGVAWDVLDLDAYGSPWPFLRAWFRSTRERAGVTHVLMTDGYCARVGLATACRALFPERKGLRRDTSVPVYFESVHARVSEWAADAGLNEE